MSIGMTNFDGGLQVRVGTFLGRELIFIGESEMEIQTWLFGFCIGKRKFANDHVTELRYDEWNGASGRTCGIRFKYKGNTHVLIEANRETQTLRTILRIIDVYKFSRSIPSCSRH
jgi:hypothetical protein